MSPQDQDRDIPPEIEQAVLALQGLARRAASEYAPIVAAILQDGSKDVAHIERTLDGLLDFAFDPEALGLYKQLCRHYFTIDPAATADYVNLYREMWDS
jgi:hypothetical protein